MPIVTYESVAEAARNLEAQGIRPSVRKVTAALGGGSPNDIGPLLGEYRAAKATVQKPTIPLDPRIQDLIVKQIEDVASDAAKAADERAAVALDDLEVVSEAGRAAEKRVQDLVQELDDARRKTAEDIATITVDKEKAEALASERQAEIARLQELLAREQAAAEDARIKVAKAQLTVDQQAKEVEIKDESLEATKNELDAVRAAKEDAEKQLAVAQALAKVAEQSIQDEKQKVFDLQKRMDSLQAEKDKVDAELSVQKSTAAAAAAALEEKKATVEELRNQIVMVSAERDRVLAEKTDLTAERDRIREAYKTQGDAAKRRENDLKVEIEGLKDSLATERQGRLQDALDKQLGQAADPKKTASRNAAKMEVAPAGA